MLEETVESPLDCKEIKPVHPKGNQSWIFIGRTDAESETPILWPPDAKNWLIWKDWCWERLKVGGEGNNRGWDVWMVSLTQWAWVWVNSRHWWWTGRPGLLESMGRKETRQQLNWTELIVVCGLLWWLSGKESACNAGDLGSIPGLGRYPGGEHGTPLQYFCLEYPHGQRNPGWRTTVHGVTKSWTRLSS